MAESPLAGWPTGSTKESRAERERLIAQAVDDNDFEHEWCEIVLSDGIDELSIFVSCDALKIDGVRVGMTARTQQEIADKFDAVLLTPKLYDEIYRHSPSANKLKPVTLSATRQQLAEMGLTKTYVKYSRLIDDQITARGASAPPTLGNVGKSWVLAKVLWSDKARAADTAANYGWLGTGGDRSVTGLPIIQSVGTRHDAEHADYSQMGLWAHRAALLNGDIVDLGDVYTGKVGGTAIVSHEGPLPGDRQPGVVRSATSGPLVPPGPAPAPPDPNKPLAPAKKASAAPAFVGALGGAAIGAATAGGSGGAAWGGLLGLLAGLFVGRAGKSRTA